MAETKGKLIILCGRLMVLYKDSLKEADNELFKRVGLHYNELDPEGWYDTKLFALFIDKYAEASITKENAIITLGKSMYPQIKRMGGLPNHIKTPIDLLKYSVETFLKNHRGREVRPKKLVEAINGRVVIHGTNPYFSQKLCKGVYLGILGMYNVKNPKVVITKGFPNVEYIITWDI